MIREGAEMKVEVIERGDSKILDILEEQDSPVVAARRAALLGVANAVTGSNIDADGAFLPEDAGTHHQISLEAIASYTALLGNGDDYNKTVREIMYIREHGEPDPDPVTAANAWTSAYEELEDSANGKPMVMALSGELAGIAKTRSMLGLPSNDGVQVMSDDVTGIQTYELSDEVSSTIASFNDDIAAYMEKFLGSLKREEEQLSFGFKKPDDEDDTQSS